MRKVWIAKIKLGYENLLCLVSREARLRREYRKNLTKNIVNDYEDLIVEYGLIQEKKSKMSKSQRDKTVRIINELVRKGHLKVN